VHANVVFVNVDASQADPARRGLHEHVIPRTSQTAGFVAGYWLEPVDGKGMSVTFWESEQAARDAAGRIQPDSSPTTGIKLDRDRDARSDRAGLARSGATVQVGARPRLRCVVGDGDLVLLGSTLENRVDKQSKPWSPHAVAEAVS
jgi:hypothetical protein